MGQLRAKDQVANLVKTERIWEQMSTHSNRTRIDKINYPDNASLVNYGVYLVLLTEVQVMGYLSDMGT